MSKIKKNRVKLLCLVLATTSSFLLLSACTKQPNDNYAKIDSDDVVQYTTDDALDPQNYTTYVNKELNLMMNLISSHVTSGDSLIKGNGVLADELASVKHSLDLAAEAITSVETLHPPKEYEDDRDTILQKMVNAKATMEAYRDTLEAEDTDSLRSIVDTLSSDYASLSGSFNMPWE